MITLLRRARARAPVASPWISREPIREELFGVERLEEHGRSLAVVQVVAPIRTGGRRLARRLQLPSGVDIEIKL